MLLCYCGLIQTCLYALFLQPYKKSALSHDCSDYSGSIACGMDIKITGQESMKNTMGCWYWFIQLGEYFHLTFSSKWNMAMFLFMCSLISSSTASQFQVAIILSLTSTQLYFFLTCSWSHIIFVFLTFTYFIEHNNLQFHLWIAERALFFLTTGEYSTVCVHHSL